jgi:uncharacterized protein (TIGR02145 family)
MRQKDIKVFGDVQSGRLNSDDSPFVLTGNEWVNAENVRTGTTDKGATGIMESVGGNVKIEPPIETVVIGTQEWTVRNLDVEYYRNGDQIPQATNFSQWGTLTTGAWCYYDFNPANGDIYGKLYNAYAVNDPRGLAPEGYHVPSAAEWSTLVSYLIEDNAGGRLKETGFTHWEAPNEGAINDVGFTALGAGWNYSVNFSTLKYVAAFWTSSTVNSSIQSCAILEYDRPLVNLNVTQKIDGLSVRLIKDADTDRYKTIGTIEDTENERLVYFNYDTDVAREDQILCLYTKTNTIYTVLKSSQVENGLNFDLNSLIHSAHIVDNILSWTDGTNNEPRKINIESGIAANHSTFVTEEYVYQFPLRFFEITTIKPPPIYCPNIIETPDISFVNNFISTSSFEFAFQYQYYDYENTVVSSYSIASRLDAPDSGLNMIQVSMDGNERIPQTVKRVSLIARVTDGTSGGGNNAFIIKFWDKNSSIDLDEINDQNNGVFPLTHNFYNNISGQYLAPDDVLRPFDNVPIYSQTHEIAKSRYFFANNTEGYDTPTTTTLNLSLGSNGVTTGSTVTLQVYRITMQSQGNTGINPPPPSKQWAYQAYAIFDGQNYQVIKSTEAYSLTNTTIPTPGAYPTTITYSSSSFYNIGFSSAQRRLFVTPRTLSPARPTGNITCNGTTYLDINTVTLLNAWITIQNFPSVVYGVWAQQSLYKFGVVFYDYAMRKCGVVNPRDKDEYTQVYSYFPSALTITSARGLNTDLIYTPLASLGQVQGGDRINISGTSGAFDGDFNVKSVSPRNGYIEVAENTIPTTAAITGVTINVFRKLVTEITTPTTAPTTATNTIKWNLSNTGAINQIPDWAYYYSVVRTLNLRTRFFIQSYISGTDPDSIKYCKRDALGVWTCTYTTIVQGLEAIAIPTAGLLRNGLGYVYDKTNGDVCILNTFTLGGAVSPLNLPVIGQDGANILLKFADLGDSTTVTAGGGIAGMQAYYEIFTPYKTTEQEVYYEVGEVYSVVNPTESTRAYSSLYGNFRGDCALVDRKPISVLNNDYKVIAMCANDLYFQRWDNDGGKVNIITEFGRSIWNNYVSWSDAIIEGSQVNGTSTFRVGNNAQVPTDCGSINKLQLTSKIQNEGTVMLSLCTIETNSMYIGETQITDSTGNTKFFSAGTSVIGTINTLKGNYGCIDPASVVQYRGNVYFFDANNGRWVQYSPNGLDNISAIKMTRFWKNWSYKYLSMTKEEIEAFGNRPYVFATVDAAHDELLISIPKLSDTPPKGFLPDYPSDVYPFDILDYQGKTIVFKLGTGAVVVPHWQGAYTYNTEYFGNMQNRLFTFKDGNIYENNQDNQNNFFGVQYDSKVMFTSNVLAQVPKVYDNFLSESNIIPNFVYFYNDYPNLQTSDLESVDFANVEGIFYASILRNKVVETNTGDVYTGLLTGEVMRNTNMYVLVRYSPTTNPLQLRLLQLSTSISSGHTF